MVSYYEHSSFKSKTLSVRAGSLLKRLVDARIVKKENERYSMIDLVYEILRS